MFKPMTSTQQTNLHHKPSLDLFINQKSSFCMSVLWYGWDGFGTLFVLNLQISHIWGLEQPTNEDSLYYTKISFDVDTTSNIVRWFVDQFLLLKVCFCISAEVRLQTRQSQCQEEHIQLVSTTHQQPTLTSPNIATCKHRLLLVWASFYWWCNKPTTTSLEFSACGALNLMDFLLSTELVLYCVYIFSIAMM